MRAALIVVALTSACGAKEASEDYIRKSKQIEARVKLKGVARGAQRFVDETGALPVGTIGPTPAQPCCTNADKKCPANAADWQAPLWDQLSMFADRQSYHFQYAYQSDGTSFTATATGDVLCEGRMVTFTISGKLGADKQLVVDESQLEYK